jgi:hypothetical protein
MTGAGAAQTAANPGAGQNQAAPQEPQYANSFYYLDADGGIKPLEREPVAVGGRVRAFGFGGTSESYQIQNEHSPVRFKAGTPIQLVVKLENHDVDPGTLVVLYSLKPDKGERQLLIAGMGFMGSHTKSDLATKQLQMTFTKYGTDSVKITPANPLTPGEYAVTVRSQGSQPVAYCFGVDAGQ